MRRQCRRFEFQRILLPVRMRIHWGMGRFWAIFFASVRFVRKVLCDGCGGDEGEGRGRAGYLSGRVCAAFRRSAVGAARRDDRRRFFGARRSAAPQRSVAAPAGVRDFCATTQQFVCGSRWCLVCMRAAA